MNVLVINTQYSGGGAEKVSRQFLKMNYDNIHMYMVVGKEKSNQNMDDRQVKVIYKNRIQRMCANLYGKILDNHQRLNIYSLCKVLYWIKKYNIDIVHFNNVHGNYIGIYDVGIVSKYCPTIYTLHDTWAFTGHCAHPMNCKQWHQNQCENCLNRSRIVHVKYSLTKKYI